METPGERMAIPRVDGGSEEDGEADSFGSCFPFCCFLGHAGAACGFLVP